MAVLSSQWDEPVIIKDSLKQDYCYVPKRPFLLGEHKVPTQLMGPFYLAKYPVSNVQFKRFVDQTGYNYRLFDIMEQISPDLGCPATPLSWRDAKAYARWIREITGEYYSLPSEAEWEFSARGRDGRLYPWGNTPPTDKHGTFSLTINRRQTNVAGKFPMNISHYGCVDMVGNIWEWCENNSEGKNPFPVLRGGSCANDEKFCNCNFRRLEPDRKARILYGGFRLLYLPQALYEKYCSILKEKSYKE